MYITIEELFLGVLIGLVGFVMLCMAFYIGYMIGKANGFDEGIDSEKLFNKRGYY